MTSSDRAGSSDAPHRVVVLTARDPLVASDGPHPLRVAAGLAGDGEEVVLVLLEDAVAVARGGHRFGDALEAATAAGVRVLAEEEALARRAIEPPADGVKPTDLGAVVDLLFDWSDRQAWL